MTTYARPSMRPWLSSSSMLESPRSRAKSYWVGSPDGERTTRLLYAKSPPTWLWHTPKRPHSTELQRPLSISKRLSLIVWMERLRRLEALLSTFRLVMTGSTSR